MKINPGRLFCNIFDLQSSGQEHITKKRYINGHVYEPKPAKYNFSLYAKASNSLRIGGAKIKIEVPRFNTDTLAMSDLILAYEITEANSNGMLNFERASIIPNPTNQFSKIEPVQLYYEIYNLSQNKSGENILYNRLRTYPIEKKTQRFKEIVWWWEQKKYFDLRRKNGKPSNLALRQRTLILASCRKVITNCK